MTNEEIDWKLVIGHLGEDWVQVDEAEKKIRRLSALVSSLRAGSVPEEAWNKALLVCRFIKEHPSRAPTCEINAAYGVLEWHRGRQPAVKEGEAGK